MIKESPHWKDKPPVAAPLISCLNSTSDPTATAVSLIYKGPGGFAFVIILWDPISSGRDEGEVWWNFVDGNKDLKEWSSKGFKECRESNVFSFVLVQYCGGHRPISSSWMLS